MDCPEGVLTKEKVKQCERTVSIMKFKWQLETIHLQVLDMLLFILPRDNGHIIADLIFTAFDK